MVKRTVDEVVRMVKPDYVSIDNPVHKGKATHGDAYVSSFKVEYDSDGVHMYVQIERKAGDVLYV